VTARRLIAAAEVTCRAGLAATALATLVVATPNSSSVVTRQPTNKLAIRVASF
jgi:hypothetical protein